VTIRPCRRAAAVALVAGIAGAGLAGTPSAAASRPAVEIASVSTGGVQANNFSWIPAVSADGRHVAFSSSSSNLVPGDTNGREDVFVRDLSRGLTRRATLDTAGEEAVGTTARGADLSKDGRYVMFTTDAGNLVPDDTNQQRDVFVRDMRHGITTRVSLTSVGGEISRFSIGDGISDDGRYVVFTTACGCVVPGDTYKGVDDVYVRDLKQGTTRRVSVASDGTWGDASSSDGSISANGRYVAFASAATNLVPGDTNGTTDVFRRDLKTGVTTRVSVGPGGRQTTGGQQFNPGFGSGKPSISANGYRVAFFASAAGLVDGPRGVDDVYVHDVKTGTTILASAGLGGVANDAAQTVPITPSLSGDGRHVAFFSWATNLVAGDTNDVADGFVRDLRKGVTRRVTLGAAGEEANSAAGHDISLDRTGKTAAYTSGANNLVPGDSNNTLDVFVARLKK
jgi:hypothetical protein